MSKNEEITEKLLELVKLASEELTESPTLVILLALLGARGSGQDVMLAKNVQNYVEDVLIPELMKKMQNNNISLN